MIRIILTCSLLVVTPALGHESKGPNGGRQVDAGSNHVELVVKDSLVEVHLSDGAGKPLDPAAYKGVAILVVAGKAVRIPLSASTGKLVGSAATSIPTAVKGAIQLTDGAGKTSQAKFD